MLFFVVYVVICHAQKLFGFKSVRYLAENAGSMQVVQGDGNLNAGHPLERSEHFQLFLYCLGLSSQIPTKHWVWDTSSLYGIRRQRYSCEVTLIQVPLCLAALLATNSGARSSISRMTPQYLLPC